MNAQSVQEISRENAAERLRGNGKAIRKTLVLEALKEQDISIGEAKERAGLILRDIILNGDSYGAVHALTYARLTEDRELVEPIRQRLNNADGSWGEQHVKLGAIHALVVLANEKFPAEIGSYLNNKDESLRVRAYMLARDSKDSSVLAEVRKRVAHESDAAIKIAGLSAMAAIEGRSSAAYSELVQAAASTGRQSVRAQLEIKEIIRAKNEDKEILTREAEEKLKMLAVSKEHDQRMYGIEMIAARGSGSAKGWLKRMGESEDWHQRLNSAYFLLQSADAKEAQIRLLSETHPLVQITLLATLRTEK